MVSGDGRFYSKEAIQIIVRMAAANGVSKVLHMLSAAFHSPAEARQRNACGQSVLSKAASSHRSCD